MGTLAFRFTVTVLCTVATARLLAFTFCYVVLTYLLSGQLAQES